VRRVWPPDGSAAAASSPSIPAIAQLSPAETKRAPRKVGAKRFQRAAVLDYLNEQYLGGVPDEVSVQSIQTALKAQGKSVSLRTIRRAMGRK
jgi:hypothetical protein